jgi:uncharacterized RDD family membrane protein YckC
VSRLEREVVTPEGIPLRIELARAGDRLGGFLLDFLILALASILVYLLAGWASSWDESWGLALGLLIAFVLRTFYFVWFEIRWQGRTPGKRAVGTRVMDAQGGALRSDAVVVRNLMRELEVWLPLAFLAAPERIWPGAPGWARLAFIAWALVFAVLPLFNRDRLRAGDMVAGTRVVIAPKAVLLADLGEATAKRGAAHAFTDAQLDVYGIHELQTLEDLLRRTDPQRRAAYEAVARQIRKKIDWRGPDAPPEGFLREFYAALRSRLEGKMLLGRRKRDKFSTE